MAIKKTLQRIALGVALAVAGVGLYKTGLEQGKAQGRETGKKTAISNIESHLLQSAQHHFNRLSYFTGTENFDVRQGDCIEFGDFLNNVGKNAKDHINGPFLRDELCYGSMRYDISNHLEFYSGFPVNVGLAH